MPFVNIQLKEGRTPAQKKEVAEAIIDLMDQLDFAKAESIRVLFLRIWRKKTSTKDKQNKEEWEKRRLAPNHWNE